RERIEGLEEQIRAADRKHADLIARTAQLEQAVRERESLVAEQEDLLQQYQVRFDDAREFASKSDGARRELEAELNQLRSGAPRSDGAAVEGDAAHVEALSAQLAQMRQVVEQIESERAELVSNHTRITTELETVRQSERVAVARVADLEATLADSNTREQSEAPFVAELEKRNKALEAELATVNNRLRDTDAGHAEIERARLLEEELERSRSEVAQLTDRLATATGGGSTGDVVIGDDEREAMIGQLQNAIGVIDKYLSEA
ncbi:MAG: hypothetical protein H7X80_00690, partial [bacterium]|nr:hypothetical protein [Candidatus Kapabacteria bacterium]